GAVAVGVERDEIVQRDVGPGAAVGHQLVERAASILSATGGGAVEGAIRSPNEAAVRERAAGVAVELVDLVVNPGASGELDRPGRAVAGRIAAERCRPVDRSVGPKRESTFGIRAVGGWARLYVALEIVQHLIGAADRHSPDDALVILAAAELRTVERTILAENDLALRPAIGASIEAVQDGKTAAGGAQAVDNAGAVAPFNDRSIGAAAIRGPINGAVADEQSADRSRAVRPLIDAPSA